MKSVKYGNQGLEVIRNLFVFWSYIYLKTEALFQVSLWSNVPFFLPLFLSSFDFCWSTVDLQYCVRFSVQQSESVIYLSLYITSFLDSFPIWAITEYWVEFPVLYSRSLLVVCFIHCSVFVSSPISQANVCFFGTCARVKLLERAREKWVELWFFTMSTLKR